MDITEKEIKANKQAKKAAIKEVAKAKAKYMEAKAASRETRAKGNELKVQLKQAKADAKLAKAIVPAPIVPVPTAEPAPVKEGEEIAAQSQP